jgi:hypothetical protein
MEEEEKDVQSRKSRRIGQAQKAALDSGLVGHQNSMT